MDHEGTFENENKSSMKTDTNNASADCRRIGINSPEDTTSRLKSDTSREKTELRHQTILGGDAVLSASISLHRCLEKDCCQGKVHCPFCDNRQYKPAQPSRVRDHLHLTHFQHAVYYDGLMIVKCFHVCRGNEYKGGHYHCPVCSTTLLKRNAFTKHLYSHASSQGLGTTAVQAPDSKKPAVIYYADKKIDLCREKCTDTLEPHFHCPLCQRNCDHLSALTSHLWRCKKRTISVAARAESRFGCSLDFGKLFSPEMAQTAPHIRDMNGLKEHLSVVRNLSDLPLQRCQLSECCKGRYHCPLCTTSKLKPNHLSHMRQHFVSHWRSGVKFRDYTVLVCYLPCQLEAGADMIRFHYHCPLCGATRRRREGFARHLVICEAAQVGGQGSDEVEKVEELGNDEGEDFMEFPSITDSSEAWSSQQVLNTTAEATATRRVSADQAELQAAESLAALDRILTESLNNNYLDTSSQNTEDPSFSEHQSHTALVQVSDVAQPCSSVMSEKDSAELSDSQDHSSPKTVSKDLHTEIAGVSTDGRITVTEKSVNTDVAMVSNARQAKVELFSQAGCDNRTALSGADRESSGLLKNAHQHPTSVEVMFLNDQSVTTTAAVGMSHLGLSRCGNDMAEANQGTGDAPSGKMDDLDATPTVHVTQMKPKNQSQGKLLTSQPNKTTQTDQAHSNISTNQCNKTTPDDQTQGDVPIKQSNQTSLNNQSQDRTLNHNEMLDSTSSTHHKGSNNCVALTNTEERGIRGSYTTIPTKDSTHDTSENHLGDLQIFRQVSTQISDGIVSQLEDRGGLDRCLEAIGQVCKVAWQRQGADVTMACELEELCHVQNCLKQIVKNGLQNFLDSPPPKQPVPVTSSVMAVTPSRTGAKKRGRPKGSRKRWTITAEKSSGQKTMNEDTPNEESVVSCGQNNDISNSSVTLADNSNHSDQSSTYFQDDKSLSPPSKVAKYRDPSHTNSGKMHKNGSSSLLVKVPVGSDIGCYSGRTRGKRINFAQLHAGNVKNLQEDDSDEEEKKPSPTVSLPLPKRGRGRPRKNMQPSVPTPLTATFQDVEKPAEDQTGKQPDEGTVTVQEVSETETQTAGDKDGGNNENISEAEGDRGGRQANEGAVSLALSKLAGDLLPDVFIDVKRNSSSESGPPSMEIMVTHSSLTSRESPTSSNGRLAKQRSLLTTEVSKLNSSGECAPVEEAEEKQLGVVGKSKFKTPTIIGGQTHKSRLHNEKGISDFVIIPNIIFNCSTDVDEKEDGVEFPEQDCLDTAIDSVTDDNIGGCAASADKHVQGEIDDKDNGKPISKLSVDRCDAETTSENESGQGQGQSHRCPMCSVNVDSYSLLAQHISLQHADKVPVTCDICEMVFPTSGALNLHLKRRHGPKQLQEGKTEDHNYRCVSCDKSYLTVGALRTHCTLVHQIHKSTAVPAARRSSLKCVVCNYVAIDRWDMRRHRDQHRLQPPTCPICKKALSTEAALKVHIGAKHSGESFSCQICSKTFAHVRYLHAHMQRHGGEKRHVCTVCGWRFHQTNTLQAHMDTHKPRTQRKYAYKCPHCPAAYNSGANWRDHLNKHTGARPHICSQCGKGFAFRSMLTTHTAFVHSLERPYSCTECSKTYKMKSQLRQHMMTHTMARTGTSPFMCGKCGRPMASKSRLHAHSARCKGNNAYKQLQVLWQTGVVPSGPESRLQSVGLLSGQAVNLQAPLVDLLPGQRINIVHHGLGKDATITLVPVQNDSTEQGQEQTILLSETQDPATTPAIVVKQEGIGKDGLSQPCGPDTTACRATEPSSVEGGILVQSSLTQTEAALAHLQSMTESNETSTPISVTSDFGSGNSQTILVQSGETVHLLTSEMHGNPGVLQTQNPNSTEETGKSFAPSTATSHPEDGGFTSQQIMALSGDHEFHTTLQNVDSSHQLVLTDGLGQTQTLLLPPDFVKQEVVVIDGGEGRNHQNVLDLSNLQIIHTDNMNIADEMDVQFEEVSDAPNSQHNEEKIQAAHPGTSDITQQLSQSNAGEVSEALDSNQPSQSAGDVELGEIYLCSMCSQQFESMGMAEQHVLLHHSHHDANAHQE